MVDFSMRRALTESFDGEAGGGPETSPRHPLGRDVGSYKFIATPAEVTPTRHDRPWKAHRSQRWCTATRWGGEAITAATLLRCSIIVGSYARAVADLCPISMLEIFTPGGTRNREDASL